ncbi:uncharacterized protein [Ptychodera flava]|uniref:uncharacterized protein n=1 Tax=Ptychodera flava TaxID=63121 RepID=UPI003969D00A
MGILRQMSACNIALDQGQLSRSIARRWKRLVIMADDFGGLGVFLLALFLLNNYSAVSAQETNDDVTEHLTQIYQSEDGHQAAILDDVLPEESLKNLIIKGYFFTSWHFQDDIKIATEENNIPWKSDLSPEFFENTHVWKILRESISHVTKSGELYPYSVTCYLQRRFDSITLETRDPDDYQILLFLTRRVKKNDYGHLSLYAPYRNGTHSIVMTAHPRHGRIVFWKGGLSHLYHPPSMNYVKAGYIITIKATHLTGRYEDALMVFNKNALEEKQKLERVNKDSFPNVPGKIPTYNMDEHVKRKFYDANGMIVAIYDDLFTKEQLDVLHAYLSSVEDNFFFGDADTEVREDSDNVAWIKAFSLDSFVKSNVWDVVFQVAKHVSGGKEGWYPYDVSLNVIRAGDHTRIHEDCEAFEYEYTFLMYMNPDWQANNYGETAYFNRIESHPLYKKLGEGNEQFEPFCAVKPKYGRVAIFRGIIPHSARPPSSAVPNARYTFAVKVGETERIAKAKALREAFELPEISEEEQALVDELIEYKHAVHSPGKPDSWLDEKLNQQLDKKERFYIEQREKAAKHLLQNIGEH